jgi:hypothetical protein
MLSQGKTVPETIYEVK